jgi:putative ABC transport system permease protein
VLLRPLPYPDADRIVSIREFRGTEFAGRTPPGRLEDWRQSSRAIGGWYSGSLSGRVGTTPVRLISATVSPGFFEVAGVAPSRGRTFTPDEERSGGPTAAVISAALARRRSIEPGAVIGSDGQAYTVVGIMPDAFALPSRSTEIWLPKQARPALLGIRRARNYNVFARAREGATPQQVASDLTATQQRLGERYPDTDAGVTLDVAPFKDRVVGTTADGIWPIFAAACLILLITCVNVGCLLTAAMAEREVEMGARLALGATRRTLMRQILGESMAYAVAGGVAGAALAAGALPLLRNALPDVPRIEEVGWHGRTAPVVAIQTTIAALTFAVLSTTRLRAVSLRASERRGVGGGMTRGLVVAQLAVATILVMAAIGFTQTFRQLQDVPLGFDPEQVLTLRISASAANESPEQTAMRHARAVEAMARVPGVTTVAVSADMPGVDRVSAQEFRVASSDERGSALIRAVSSGYFGTLHIPFERGATCAASADPLAPFQAIVNETFARRFLSGRDATVQSLIVGAGNVQSIRVVGVVRDVREQGYDVPVEPTIYTCGPMRFWAEPYYLARTNGDAAALAAGFRAALAAAEPTGAIFGVATATDVLSETLSTQRLRAWLVGLFAAISLVLAAAGVYGVLSYAVSLKRSEIGLRMAMGATHANIWAGTMGVAARWCAAGLTIGWAASVLVAAVASATIAGAVTAAPGTFVLAAVVLTASCLGASAVPALRASLVSPAELLRR